MHPCFRLSKRSTGSGSWLEPFQPIAEDYWPIISSCLVTWPALHQWCRAGHVMPADLLLVNETRYLILLVGMIQVSFHWPRWPFGYLQARMHQIKQLKMDSWNENYFLTGETQDRIHFRSIGKMIRLLVHNINIGLTLPISNYWQWWVLYRLVLI